MPPKRFTRNQKNKQSDIIIEGEINDPSGDLSSVPNKEPVKRGRKKKNPDNNLTPAPKTNTKGRKKKNLITAECEPEESIDELDENQQIPALKTATKRKTTTTSNAITNKRLRNVAASNEVNIAKLLEPSNDDDVGDDDDGIDDGIDGNDNGDADNNGDGDDCNDDDGNDYDLLKGNFHFRI